MESTQQRHPLAEVRVQVYGLGPGEGGVQVWVSPDGPFRGIAEPGPDRRDAYARLLHWLQRELTDALTALGDMSYDS